MASSIDSFCALVSPAEEHAAAPPSGGNGLQADLFVDEISADRLCAALPEPSTVGCELRRAALDFVSALEFSEAAQQTCDVVAVEGASFTCEQCGRNGRLFCGRCQRTPLPLPIPVRLGVQALILCHHKEPAWKSSCGPLPLLSPDDIELCDWPLRPQGHQSSALAQVPPQPPGTWLVFPREDAVDACLVDWSCVSKLVFIDSRWKHANAVASDVTIAALPAMRLNTDTRSCFWRTATEKLDGFDGLLSTAECLRQICCVRAAALGLGDEMTGRFDDLLLFFVLRLRLILEEYAQSPGRCCPWCTEVSRRRCVHEGNARKAAQRTASTCASKASVASASLQGISVSSVTPTSTCKGWSSDSRLAEMR
eukprot:TRINITY_DN54624_c0_g1_i1.p1 TRINITY_DN54624_c0_g1~~TRINITY_DN54624_c0_g1_i1.p1  ORF type:complete len:367 (-),score=50.56 TRINITY_DN54624_c0_g1_i1:62-1162(-)